MVERNLRFSSDPVRPAIAFESFGRKPSVEESARLLENYFDKLLAWNQETGGTR